MNKGQCKEFLKDPTKNPMTKKRISRGGKVYHSLLKSCSNHLKFERKKSKVHLYGSPTFVLFYWGRPSYSGQCSNLREKTWMAIDISNFRPDPKNYLKNGKIYRATLNMYSIDDFCMIHSIEVYKKNKSYEFLYVD